MADLVVLVPSRERPQAACELVQAFAETATGNSRLVFVVDDTDPTRDQYPQAILTPTYNMVQALNVAAQQYADSAYAIGFMGDDHRPRTVGWDTAYLEALLDLGTGIVYGDDGYQGKDLPTQCAMTADIVQALGYMAPPGLRHMYVDNFWLTLGRAADCIRYLPDVVIEHMHPVAGKAEWSEGHKRVNTAEVYDHDAQVFAAWQAWHRNRDVARVRALR